MNYYFYICLFILWTLFGSFWSVLIYRLRSCEWWIFNWRSHCSKCNTILKALDLVPVVSWVMNKARCKYCEEKVSHIYPLLEISTWLLFSFIWYFLIDFNLIINLDLLEITKLVFWLIIWFITILYIYYDILFLEIHEWMLLTWIWIILLWLWAQTLFLDFTLINILPSWIDNLSIWFFSILLTLIIIWILYIIMLKELREIYDILFLLASIWSLYLFNIITWINISEIAILNWLVWVLIIFLFFFLQIIISRWKWMWWGDLRIAIMIWLILGINFSFPWLMLTYLVWSIIWIIVIIHGKIKNSWKKLNTQIPFWPFLAIWFFLTIFYSNQINNIMSNYF